MTKNNEAAFWSGMVGAGRGRNHADMAGKHSGDSGNGRPWVVPGTNQNLKSETCNPTVYRDRHSPESPVPHQVVPGL